MSGVVRLTPCLVFLGLGFFTSTLNTLLTKADKLSNNKARNQRTRIAKQLGVPPEDLIATSAVTAAGVQEVRRLVGDCYEAVKSLHFNDRDKDAK